MRLFNVFTRDCILAPSLLYLFVIKYSNSSSRFSLKKEKRESYRIVYDKYPNYISSFSRGPHVLKENFTIHVFSFLY